VLDRVARVALSLFCLVFGVIVVWTGWPTSGAVIAAVLLYFGAEMQVGAMVKESYPVLYYCVYWPICTVLGLFLVFAFSKHWPWSGMVVMLGVGYVLGLSQPRD
jgi:uncharacterized membrane protein YphA (DoxX/SURF4 family)